MISPCYGCDLQILTVIAAWYTAVWGVIMIIINIYGLFLQARRRSILAEEQFNASFIPESGNTIDLSELEAVREKVETQRSRLWGFGFLFCSIVDLIFSFVFIQGVNTLNLTYILYWCIFHTLISYVVKIMTISAIKCSHGQNDDKPLGLSVWNVLYMAVDLYLLWVAVSFMSRIKHGFEDQDNDSA